ncbi:MAG: sigma-70 family RNA polymerase sigma factor [Planctomycetes bacterium]|nr:sigma-70 family RNA polymerase sigma factor [Planctomycetota bacterium]
MVARLVRALGPGQLELAEDVTQEALVRALRAWPVQGVPREPEAWLFRVAKNLALDGLRRRRVGAAIEQELADWAAAREATTPPPPDDEAPADDTLRMMFLCAHPLLAEDVRLPLVLKSVCGFGNSEIAAALLTKEGTIAQRLTRAKARLAAEGARFELPRGDELDARLDDLLAVLYLVFNEGYRAHRGEALVRVELVYEALRLARLLAAHPATARPDVHALVALMFLSGARLPARQDALGELLTLAEQDRALWDRRWLAAGGAHLARSLGGERLSVYHAEAAIASLHAAAPDYASTDWPAILREYERLLALRDDPVARLNRVVALAKVRGARAALTELEALGDEGPLAEYRLRWAVRAQLAWDLGETGEALRALDAALALPCAEPERRVLERRRAAVAAGEPPPAW